MIDVLTYRIPGLVTLTISTRGKIERLQSDYAHRFNGGPTIGFRVSDPGDLTVWPNEQQSIIDKSLTFKPVMFETPNYFVEAEFDNDSGVEPDSMFLRHHLEDVAGRFCARGLSLIGQLSFVNEPGKFRLEVAYTRGGAERSFWIEFLVASTKMDVENDYRAIVSKVEQEDRNLIFSSYAKTVNDVSVKERARMQEDGMWAVYFERAFDEYETAVKRILHEPHKRIVSQEDFRRVDQIRRWTPGMVREYARYEHDQARLAAHRFWNERSENTFDTYENRFVKFTLGKMGDWLEEARSRIGEDERYSEDFRLSLTKRAARFAQDRRAPILKGVGRFQASAGGSLVLQMRPGYSQIRIVWDLMHSLFTSESTAAGNRFSVGFNSLAALYEFWCFVTMRDLLEKVLGHTEDVKRESVMPSGLTIGKVLEDALAGEDAHGVKSMGYRYSFKGEPIAELMFQQSYGPETDNEQSAGYARPFHQRPDIVLRIFQKKHSYTYLFDAKYQLEAGYDQVDAAPRAALDQMHRYRDAILYRQQSGAGKVTRDVIGAYILFPGDESRDEKIFDYTETMEEQNLGAFPLLPDKTKRLESFLQGLMVRAFAEEEYASWILAEAIPQRWLSYVGDYEQVLTNRSILVARGYPKDFVKTVEQEKLCPWIVPAGVDPSQIKLILCGSVNGVDKIVLDATAKPEGPFDKATFLALHPSFAVLEPSAGSSARAFPLGNYYVWKAKYLGLFESVVNKVLI